MCFYPRAFLAVALICGLVWMSPASALVPDDDPQSDPPRNLAFGTTQHGLQALGDGTWQLRRVVDLALPGVLPGTGGQWMAEACLDQVRAQPAQFAGVSVDSLRVRRQHPVPFRTGTPGLLWSVEFEQYIDGRSLEDTYLQFHVEDRTQLSSCRMRLLLGRIDPGVTLLPTARLTDDEARAAAAKKMELSESAMRITRERHAARRWPESWVPVLHVTLGFDGVDVVVNQLTGDVTIEPLYQSVDTVTVQASVSVDTDDPDNHTTQPLRNLAAVHGGGTEYTDVNGEAQVPDASVSDIWLTGLHCETYRWDAGARQTSQINGTGTADFNDTTEFHVAENEAYYHTDAVWTYLSTRIDTAVADSFLDTFAMEVQVNFNDFGNANFQDNGGELNNTGPRIRLFREGGGYHNTSMGDVIYHEYGHYVDWAMGGIFEKGGLSEGWSDILSAFITDDPELAEGLFTADPPRPLRNSDNTVQWDENARVHTGGTAFAGFAWRIRTALGLARAEQLMFAALEANTISVPDSIMYVDVFDVLNGGDAASQAAIQAAAAAQGLDGYLGPAFRITGMTSDVGFTWQGTAVTANVAVTVENTELASKQITVMLTGTDIAINPQITATLASGDSETLNFQWELSGAPAGDYDVLATASSAALPDDTDSIRVTVGPSGGSSVFFDDFENGLGQWSSLTGSWAGEAAQAHSGTQTIADSPGDVYARSSETAAVTNSFSLVGVRDTRVSFWQAHWLEHTFDYGTVEMSSAGGPWMTIGIANGFRTLHHTSFDASAFDGLADVKLRLRLWTDQYFNHDGWFVDDLRVYGESDAGSQPGQGTQLAYDGFESGNFTGGSGWSAGWTTSGDATIQTTGPAVGTQHARVVGATAAGSRGRIERFVDLSGQVRVRISVLMWTDGERVETFWPADFPSDFIHVSVTDNGGASWTPWFTFFNGHCSTAHQYHLFDVALADLGLSATATVGIRFNGDAADSAFKLAFVDEVTVYTENHPPAFDPVVGNRTVAPDQRLQFTVAATDIDGHAVTLSATNLPGGATFAAATGEFDWTPTRADLDQQFVVTFEADDGVVASPVTMDVAIDVKAAGDGSGGCRIGPERGQLWLLAGLLALCALLRRRN